MSEKPFKSFKDTPQKAGPMFYTKPEGLWYGVGDDWFRFTAGNYSKGIKPYIYEIEVNDKDIFHIRTEKEMDEFTDVYGTRMLPDVYGIGDKDDAIDWNLLARGYTGIEIAPFIYSRHMELKWYYGWDAASGCIWSKEAFKRIELVVNLDEGMGKTG